jgi:hypothetical protein
MEEDMRLSGLIWGWGLTLLVASSAFATEGRDGAAAAGVSENGVGASAGAHSTLPSKDGAEEVPDIVLDDRSQTPASGGIVLGPKGIDSQGRTGRLHTVTRGDTLWDLSAAYLGTPWVWPSVWIDNEDISNPHRISPGDKIWITATEMRIVTDAEAAAYLSASSVELDPAAGVAPVAALEEAPPSETRPVAPPEADLPERFAPRTVTVSARDSYGFVSTETLKGASTIVDSPSERTFLASGDQVYLGLGEGEVEVGDQYMIFRVEEEVRDLERNRVIGHHVETLGWAEIRELTGDTSIAEIRQSYHEIPRGSRVISRPALSRQVERRSTPHALEGQVVYLPNDHTVAADGGYVYLNRGVVHGVEIGSELEVYDAGAVMRELERGVGVRTPDRAIAKLVVVTVESESAVAFVLSSKRELAVGDTVRPVPAPQMAQR